MGRGNTSLDNQEYDSYLASSGKERELRERQAERKALSKNVVGWHFGHGQPFKAESKEHFKKELEKRGLLMKDEVVKVKDFKSGKDVWVHK